MLGVHLFNQEFDVWSIPVIFRVDAVLVSFAGDEESGRTDEESEQPDSCDERNTIG